MNKLILLFVGLLLFTGAQAQTNWQQQYINAKSFYTEGKYALAMEAFKPLIEEAEGNYFTTYSSFFYAISAYKSGYVPMAKNMMLQIKSKYPTWTKMDEVNYWLGLFYFEEKQMNQGLNVLKEIKDKKIKEDVEALKHQYISRIEDIVALQAFYELHPEEKIAAKLLAHKIADLPLVDQDRKLLNDIIEKFDFDPALFDMLEIEKSEKKNQYKIAVIMPFMAEDLEPNERKKVNQFVLDLYQGIQLAVDTLKNEGINLRLFAYDSKRSKKTTEEILAKEEMLGMDLIIGPLYSQCIEVVNDFSYKNKINVINPLSSNSDVIGQNPFAFLFSPSNETVGRKSAEYVIDNINKKPGVIIFEDDPTQIAIASAYAKRAAQDSLNIIIVKKIEKGGSREVLDMLLIENARLRDASTEEAKEKYEIPLDSIGHIFVATNDNLISSKVLSAVETRGDSITVIGSVGWLEMPVIKYDMYSKLGTVLYAPNYIVNSTTAYQAFRDSYIKKHKEVPNKYAEVGYEIVQLTGRALYKYGKYFQLGWKENGKVPGYLSAGFDFTLSNDNLQVPMLTFDDEEVYLKLKN